MTTLADEVATMLQSKRGELDVLTHMQAQFEQMLEQGLIRKQVYDIPLVNVTAPAHAESLQAFVLANK